MKACRYVPDLAFVKGLAVTKNKKINRQKNKQKILKIFIASSERA
jgi:hypothetical protein